MTITKPYSNDEPVYYPLVITPNIAHYNPKNLFMLKIEGTSMVNADIKDGDFGVFHASDTLINGAIMAVKYQGKSFVKRIKVRKNDVQLIWCDGSGTSLLTPFRNIEPQGELVSILKIHDEEFRKQMTPLKQEITEALHIKNKEEKKNYENGQ